MVLLDILVRLSGMNRWRIEAAHFNHQLRGRSSDADERLVERTARRLGIPFVTGSGNVKAYAKAHGLSIEMAARTLRHDFLARTAIEKNIHTVALAHHADDQVELFFVRLLRGSSVEGLAGMKWSAPSPSQPKVRLIRPLLGCSQDQIDSFAREAKIAFREDQTNRSLDFFRNRVRRELLPMLRENYQPALSKIILRLMEVLAAESDLVAQAVLDWLETRRRTFDSLPVAVQRRVLQFQVHKLGFSADFDLIEHLRLHAKSPLTLSPNVLIERDSAGVLQIRHLMERQGFDAELRLELTKKRGSGQFAGIKFRWQIQPLPAPIQIGALRELLAKHSAVNCEIFDADKIGAKVALRHWRPGDRFQPIGMNCGVKLQDIFVNSKVPRALRSHLALATAANGEVFWVEGLRISDAFKLDRASTRGLFWCWETI